MQVWCFVLIQGETSFLIVFLPKKKQHPSVWMLSQWPQKGKEKDASSVLLWPFSVVFTVLSMIIVAYIDLRFNSKTLSIHSQNLINLLSFREKFIQNVQTVL
jgi:hypothetical protein